MKVLVTGGCGFIGSHIVDKLISKGHEVMVVDNLSTGNLDNLNKKAQFTQVDIRDTELADVFNKFRPEVVYHEAAQIDIQRSIKEPSFDATVNVVGTIKVLECCKNYNVKKIIYASSAAIYGNPEYLPVDEKHSKNPISYYGISKYTPEFYIKVFSQLYGLKFTIFRYANVYGIRQDPKGEGGVISIFLSKMLKGNKPTIFGDGKQTRDFIYVKDIAEANVAALENGDNQIMNCSTNIASTVNELTELMKKQIGIDIETIYGNERKGDILDSYLDNSKIKNVLNWQPKYSLSEGIKETVEYYRNKIK